MHDATGRPAGEAGGRTLMQIGGYGSFNAGIPGLYSPGTSTQRPPVVTDGAAAGAQGTSATEEGTGLSFGQKQNGQDQSTLGLVDQSRGAGFTDSNRGSRLNIVV